MGSQSTGTIHPNIENREYRLVRPKFVWGTGLLSHLKLAALSTQPQSVEKGASYLRLIHILKDWVRIVFPCQVFVLFDFINTLLVDLLHSISKTFIVFAFSQPPIPNFFHIITINIVKLYRHNKVSTAKLKNSIIYFIIICLFVCEMQEGIEPTMEVSQHYLFNHSIRLQQQDCIGGSTVNGVR